MGMAEGVLAADGIPNLSEEDDHGEKKGAATLLQHTRRSNRTLLITHGACFRQHWVLDGWGLLLEEVTMLRVK